MMTSTTTRCYSRSFRQELEADPLAKFKYQYPLAKEPPEIKQTQALDVSDKVDDGSSPAKKPAGAEDRYDRSGISDFEIEQIRKQQETLLSKNVSSMITPGDTVPPGVPGNLPSSQLTTPITELTQLDNGIRVVSQELSSSGLSSTLGVVSAVGSRFEKHPSQRGATNVLQLLSFGTPTPSYPDPISFLMDLGGAAHICDTAREQSIHCIDLLRPHVDEAFPLLREVLLEPQWVDDFVEQAKKTLEYQAEDAPPEAILGEAMQLAAFGSDQQLGQSHMYLEDNPELTASVVQDFWQSRFVNNPKELVVSCAGIEHDHLVQLTKDHFGHLQQVASDNSSAKQASEYLGGQVILDRMAPDGLVRVGLGFKVGGWHSEDLVTVCVLQTLLGGGSSFSAGGPGKGMYSRLYRQILNRYGWAESSEAFAAFYDELGVFGLSGSTAPKRANDMLRVFAEHLVKLAVEPVTDEELNRAKNMLRGNVLTQLESRFVLFEDMGRQVLTYGHREQVLQTCAKIDAVTKADIKDVVMRAISKTSPTCAVVGGELADGTISSYDEICRWFS